MNGKLTATLSARGRLKATLSKAIERVEPIIKPLEITENGNYSATENIHGFNPVNVNVPLKYEEGYTDGYQASQDSITLQEKTITENGEFVTDEGFTGMSKVIVAVPIKEEQTKTVEITKNGTTEVIADEGKSMSKVTVNTNVAFEGDIGKPYIDTSKMNSFNSFIRYNYLLVDFVNNLDVSNGNDFSNMFYGVTIETIPPLDTKKGTTFSYMFYNCKAKEIQSLNLSNAYTASSMFNNCSNLETINIVGTTQGIKSSIVLEFPQSTKLKNITIPQGWKNSIYVQYSSVITVESLHGMIENLADLTGQTAKTFQIGATNLAKVDEEHINMLKAKNWNYS